MKSETLQWIDLFYVREAYHARLRIAKISFFSSRLLRVNILHAIREPLLNLRFKSRFVSYRQGHRFVVRPQFATDLWVLLLGRTCLRRLHLRGRRGGGGERAVGSRSHDKLVINFMRSHVSYAVGNFTVTAGQLRKWFHGNVARASPVFSIHSPMSRIELTRYFECGIIGLWPKRVIRAVDITIGWGSEPRAQAIRNRGTETKLIISAGSAAACVFVVYA